MSDIQHIRLGTKELQIHQFRKYGWLQLIDWSGTAPDVVASETDIPLADLTPERVEAFINEHWPELKGAVVYLIAHEPKAKGKQARP